MDALSRYFTIDTDNSYYHNAKLLLTVYGRMLWKFQELARDVHIACDASQHDDILFALDALEKYQSDSDLDEIRQRLECMEINCIMMSIVEDGLERMRRYPIEGSLLYDILRKTYIPHEKCTDDELMQGYHLSRSSLYRRKKKAVEIFGSVIWGVTLPAINKKLNLSIAANKIETNLGLD